METTKFSVDFFLVCSFLLLIFESVQTSGSNLSPFQQVPQQQAIYHGANQAKPHYLPAASPPATNPNVSPYQVKYDSNKDPIVSLGNNGLATEHGDRAANYGEFPYKVQIRKNGEFVAGGTLVKSPVTGKHVIITATHVFDDNKETFGMVPIWQFELKMGVVGKESVGQKRQIKAMLAHPEYVKLNTESHRPIFNDITILIPERDFDENQFVKTIDLPAPDNVGGPWAGNYVNVKGWGLGREAGHDGASSTLRVVEVPVWSDEKCRMTYWYESGRDIITNGHFCAGYENGGTDTCQGDSGGGAISMDRGKSYLAGIVSWGKGCGKPGYPGVYVKVIKYMEWIKQTLYNYELRGIFPPPLRFIKF